MAGLSPRVEEHLEKIATNPESPSVSHWMHEVDDWLLQMEGMVPHVGKKTAAEWVARLEAWRLRLGG